MSPGLGLEVGYARPAISSSSRMAAGSEVQEKSISENRPIDPSRAPRKTNKPNDQYSSKLTLSLEDLVGCSFSFSLSAVVGRGFGGADQVEDCSRWL